jgi:predicted small secreted protein
MKKIIAVILAVLFVAVLTGCNTARGFGKDLRKAGEKIEEISK